MGLAVAVVHGRAALDGAAEAFEAALMRGRATLQNRHKTDPRSWLADVEAACDAPLISHRLIGETDAAGAFYAWSAPVTQASG